MLAMAKPTISEASKSLPLVWKIILMMMTNEYHTLQKNEWGERFSEILINETKV